MGENEQKETTTEQKIHMLLTVSDEELLRRMKLWNARQKREHVYVVSYEQEQEKRSAEK